MAETVDEEIKFKIGAEGAERAAELIALLIKNLEHSSAVMAKLEGSTRKTGTALTSLDTINKQLNADLSKLATTAEQTKSKIGSFQDVTRRSAAVVGQLTGAVSTLSPELGAMTSGVGRAGAALGLLGNVAGGPVLIGITLAVGAFAALSKLLKDTKEDADGAATALERAANKQAKFLEAATGRTKFTGMGRTAEGREELQAAIAAMQSEQRSDITPENAAEQRALRADLARARRELASTNVETESSITFATPEQRRMSIDAFRRRELTGASRGGGGRRADEASAFLERDAARRSTIANIDAQMAGGPVDTGAAIQSAVDTKKAQLDAEFEAQRAHTRAIIDDAKARDAELAQLDEQAAARQQLNRDMAVAGFQAVGSTGIKALQMLAKGQKVTAKAIVAGIGDALVASGERTIMEGIALSLNPLTPGLGGPMAAHGAAMVAAGLVMGAATSRSGAGGGGGGGGRGGNMTRGPASPSLSPGTTNASGGGTRVYQVTMSSVVAPGPEDGQRVRRALQEADRAGL